jgi:hypothetical protein
LSAFTFFLGIALFDVLDFIDDNKIDLMVCDQVADEFDGVGLLEFLEVEYEIVIFVAINGDRAAFFLVNVAVGIDLGDRFCPSFDGAVKGDDDGEFR